jgi:hypothetical protein
MVVSASLRHVSPRHRFHANRDPAVKTIIVWGLTVLLLTANVSGGLLEDMGIDSEASAKVRDQQYYPKPTKKPPAQMSGAEGVPPLPLPAVPLRRTEKKNPPRPPVLIAKLANSDRVDWATSPQDATNLLRWMAKEMNVHFSTINLPQTNIPTSAAEMPVLYRSGIKSFAFSDDQRQRLRSYLLSGGTLILNAYCGHPDFARSALQEMQKLLPERPPYRMSIDHPLYHSYYDVKKIRYRKLALDAGAQPDVPAVIGIDINTRTAVFFFRYDISSAWDDVPEAKRHCIGYDIQTSKVLGANLMSYITAERHVAISLAKSIEFVDENKGQSGKFTIAQARYGGLWRTRDAGLSMLLNVFHEKTETPVRFKHTAVDLDSPQLFDAPFVYLTGQMDFRLTRKEQANLRSYLSRGGILFAEATCGRPSFQEAFVRELKGVLPDAQLTRLPASHMLFRFPNRIDAVQPRPALAERLKAGGKVPPVLYGISINGNLAVIYSPHDLSGGWAMGQGPYNAGIANADALAMGVNIMSYILLQ